MLAVCLRCGLSYAPATEFCRLDGEKLVRRSEDPMLGRTLERYQIVAFIGSGAMARVYRARHAFLEQDYAVKILSGEIGSDRQLAERFRREALAASKIKHQNVGAVIDFGVSPEGLTFSVMELIHGESLAQRILRGPIDPPEAARIAKEIASGLAAAHELGFVHRDLKPGNVMLAAAADASGPVIGGVNPPAGAIASLNASGPVIGGVNPSAGAIASLNASAAIASLNTSDVAKVVDFGLVRLDAASDPETSRLTQTGQIFGTPMYMAPEQIAGAEVGPAADLYALGGILYEMLVGKPPFSGAFHLVLARQLSEKPAPIASFGGLGELALSLLEKAPEARPKSATAVVAALQEILAKPLPSPSRAKAAQVDDAATFVSSPTPRLPSSKPPWTGPAKASAPPSNRAAIAWVLGLLLLFGLVAVGASLSRAPADPPAMALAKTSPEPAPSASPEEPEAAREDPPEASPHPAEQGLPQASAGRSRSRPRDNPRSDRGAPRERQRRQSQSLASANGTSFLDMERELSTLLAQRGLVLDDLTAFDAGGVERWRSWIGSGGPPPGAPVAATLDRLKSAARVAFIDASFLSKKLDRVLAKMKKAAERGASVQDVEERYVALRRDLARPLSSSELAMMATRISALEQEVARK